ncbi:hypothetical protein CLIM01_09526 [Colletotrichum limetticola]|uniref:Uncharacterized protein n=1 Tax=Colletotrichum limetticola TaxID=1209924 RepID=A0ABQ9PNN1_9PEZI|nr:hypothetical protein CLIM01_09526 [Colletotrichum limetticola]
MALDNRTSVELCPLLELKQRRPLAADQHLGRFLYRRRLHIRGNLNWSKPVT